MKKEFIYIHGFNSAASDKMNFLSDKETVVSSLSLNYKPSKAIAQLENYISNCENDLHLIGMSLGGFYAIFLTEKFGLKNTILINPSTNAPENLRRALGENTNYKTNEQYVLTEEHLKQLFAYKIDKINMSNYLCFIGELDDVVSSEVNLSIFENHVLLKNVRHRVASLSEYEKLIRDFSWH